MLHPHHYDPVLLVPAIQGGAPQRRTDVRTAIIPGSDHWPAEEQPAALAAIIDDFAVSARREYGQGDRHS